MIADGVKDLLALPMIPKQVSTVELLVVFVYITIVCYTGCHCSPH